MKTSEILARVRDIKERIEALELRLEVSKDTNALLGLVADIRAAVGDPTGKLMQDELVARCRSMRSALEKLAVAESSGDWGQDIGCVKAIAKQAIE